MWSLYEARWPTSETNIVENPLFSVKTVTWIKDRAAYMVLYWLVSYSDSLAGLFLMRPEHHSVLCFVEMFPYHFSFPILMPDLCLSTETEYLSDTSVLKQ